LTLSGTSQFAVSCDHGLLHDVLLCRPDHFDWLPTSSVSRATLASGALFDRAAALREYDEMLAAYKQADVSVHFLETDPALPYQVYARDSSVMTPYGPLITQLAQWWRRGEYAPAIRFYEAHDTPIWRMITAGSLEGGDVALIEPGLVVIGWSGERTQQQAAEQLGGWLREEGWEVLLEPIAPHYVHIDVMLAAIASRLAVVCPDIASDRLLRWLEDHRIETVTVNFRDAMRLAGNVTSLGEARVLSSAQALELNRKLRALGFDVLDPDISMFAQGGGGIHCLCQPLRRADED
jgi:N-dimethylarginine dimethylaminohydrolase